MPQGYSSLRPRNANDRQPSQGYRNNGSQNHSTVDSGYVSGGSKKSSRSRNARPGDEYRRDDGSWVELDDRWNETVTLEAPVKPDPSEFGDVDRYRFNKGPVNSNEQTQTHRKETDMAPKPRDLRCGHQDINSNNPCNKNGRASADPTSKLGLPSLDAKNDSDYSGWCRQQARRDSNHAKVRAKEIEDRKQAVHAQASREESQHSRDEDTQRPPRPRYRKDDQPKEYAVQQGSTRRDPHPPHPPKKAEFGSFNDSAYGSCTSEAASSYDQSRCYSSRYDKTLDSFAFDYEQPVIAREFCESPIESHFGEAFGNPAKSNSAKQSRSQKAADNRHAQHSDRQDTGSSVRSEWKEGLPMATVCAPTDDRYYDRSRISEEHREQATKNDKSRRKDSEVERVRRLQAAASVEKPSRRKKGTFEVNDPTIRAADIVDSDDERGKDYGRHRRDHEQATSERHGLARSYAGSHVTFPEQRYDPDRNKIVTVGECIPNEDNGRAYAAEQARQAVDENYLSRYIKRNFRHVEVPEAEEATIRGEREDRERQKRALAKAGKEPINTVWGDLTTAQKKGNSYRGCEVTAPYDDSSSDDDSDCDDQKNYYDRARRVNLDSRHRNQPRSTEPPNRGGGNGAWSYNGAVVIPDDGSRSRRGC